MKEELKKLYAKDSKLAVEVAEVLGYKIKVKAVLQKKDLSKVLKSIRKADSIIEKAVSDLNKSVKNSLPESIGKYVSDILSQSDKLKDALKRL